ncbi:ABC transporter ATP-binding protein [Litoreibacter roseus]|uniref:ABC transporter ATP-binding protein n=1 Tax=Litoreibacter roseus TaxID=2601869 RepID=A0A6N6JFP4_9RHOB|nr:ATP-binding cassette domain-containing protein [Litoreibacter roseus]GFE64954.1 ABC transporter ATP-binding protein [Litoreibacter roseus]
MGPALSISDLRVTSPSGRSLLDVSSLNLPAGKTMGIAGPSGAGKSTLLFAVAGLIVPTAGRIAWDDTVITDMRQRARTAFRRRSVGMIFQDFLLFDELGAAANAGVSALFQPAAKRVALQETAETHLNSFGLSDVSRPVASFSGGERQRVAAARALAGEATILLADEPTASLHREAADALTDDLLDQVAARGMTMVVVSHDAALLNRMDSVVEITDGRINHG